MKRDYPDFDYRVIEPNKLLAKTCSEKGYKTIVDFVENVNTWLGEIDFICCFEVFEHIRNPEYFLEQFKKLLKPGGKLLITSLSRDGLDINQLQENADIVAPPQHLNFFSIRGYQNIFSRLGFSKTEIITPGKLDIDILKKNQQYIKDPFWKNVLTYYNEDQLATLQKFIALAGLSSHMMITVIK